ncbi:MAG: phosphonate dehydrogenase [Burkholderiales bacterium]|nr:phosphonate dehydrogenase [Burkholderiales bacterium]
MPRIVVTSRAFPETLDLLRAHGEVVANADEEPWSAERLRAECRDAEAMLAFMPDTVDDAFLAACPRLRIVACALKGFDNFDVAACATRGVWLTIVPDLLTEPTAELTVGLMIGLGRLVLPADALVRGGGFQGWRPVLYGRSIDGANVGILGGGAVGRAIARKLAGFDCATSVYDRVSAGPLPANARWSSLDEVIATADFLVVALPLNTGTRHLVDGALIGRLRAGTLLVNPGRGSVVDERAVADALASGQLGGYAADVFELEDWALPDRPTAIDARLLADRARTVFTAHIGSAVQAVRRRIELDAALNIVEALRGDRPHGAIGR